MATCSAGPWSCRIALRLSHAVDGMRHPSRQAGTGSDAAIDIAIVLAFALTCAGVGRHHAAPAARMTGRCEATPNPGLLLTSATDFP